MSVKEFKNKVQTALTQNIWWIDPEIGKELKKKPGIATMNEDNILRIAKDIQPRKKKQELLDAIDDILSDRSFKIDKTIRQNLLKRIENSSTISALVKQGSELWELLGTLWNDGVGRSTQITRKSGFRRVRAAPPSIYPRGFYRAPSAIY